LESYNEVAVYTKLPNCFYVNTPLGHNNPDRAVVFHEDSDIKHIYFVAETKGYDKDSLKDYRRAESVKIECASRHFAISQIATSHMIWFVSLLFLIQPEKNGGDCYSKTEQTVTVLMAQN
jgi:type III restriction enzyme